MAATPSSFATALFMAGALLPFAVVLVSVVIGLVKR
jgi:hypothetical protein